LFIDYLLIIVSYKKGLIFNFKNAKAYIQAKNKIIRKYKS